MTGTCVALTQVRAACTITAGLLTLGCTALPPSEVQI